jgi:hypothetical protein
MLNRTVVGNFALYDVRMAPYEVKSPKYKKNFLNFGKFIAT